MKDIQSRKDYEVALSELAELPWNYDKSILNTFQGLFCGIHGTGISIGIILRLLRGGQSMTDGCTLCHIVDPLLYKKEKQAICFPLSGKQCCVDTLSYQKSKEETIPTIVGSNHGPKAIQHLRLGQIMEE